MKKRIHHRHLARLFLIISISFLSSCATSGPPPETVTVEAERSLHFTPARYAKGGLVFVSYGSVGLGNYPSAEEAEDIKFVESLLHTKGFKTTRIKQGADYYFHLHSYTKVVGRLCFEIKSRKEYRKYGTFFPTMWEGEIELLGGEDPYARATEQSMRRQLFIKLIAMMPERVDKVELPLSQFLNK